MFRCLLFGAPGFVNGGRSGASSCRFRKGRQFRHAAIGFVALAFATSAQSQSTSKDAALSGRRAWDAMRCAGYAAFAENANEQMRLEKLGLNEGRVFLTAARDGKIAQSDFESTVPLRYYPIMTGPTVDFVLGRIWQAAEEYVGDKLWERDRWDSKNDYVSPDKAAIKARAQRYYDSENCKSLR